MVGNNGARLGLVAVLLLFVWCGAALCQEEAVVLPPSVDVSSVRLQTIKDLRRTLRVKSDLVSVRGEDEDDEEEDDEDVGIGSVEIVELGDVYDDEGGEEEEEEVGQGSVVEVSLEEDEENSSSTTERSTTTAATTTITTVATAGPSTSTTES